MTTLSQRLRQKLLDLAIRGKLVPQDAHDEPASELLERIRNDELGMRNGRARRAATAEPIPDDEKPFDLPKGWTWCRLGEVCDVFAGYPFDGKKYAKEGIRICGGLIIMPDRIKWDECKYWANTDGLEEYLLKPEDVVVALDRPWISSGTKIGIIKEHDLPCLLIQRTARLRSDVLAARYLVTLLGGELFRQFCDPTGTTVPHISHKDIEAFPIPLPPLAEQKRIVAALDGMLAAADAVAAGTEKIAALKEKARAKILDLAIRGKLVKQEKDDEPADVLLARIRRGEMPAALTQRTQSSQGDAENLDRINGIYRIESEGGEASLRSSAPFAFSASAPAGRKRNPVNPVNPVKKFPPITDDEMPFDLPKGWAWCRLGEIAESFSAKPYQILESKIVKIGKYPVVSQGQKFIDGYCDDETKVCGDKVGADHRAARNCDGMDAPLNANCGADGVRALPVIVFGDHTRNVKYVDFPFVVGADGTKLFHSFVDAKWTYYWTLHAATIMMESRGYGRHWNVLCGLPIPLPPLAEQKRIVAKVDEMLAACEKLGMRNGCEDHTESRRHGDGWANGRDAIRPARTFSKPPCLRASV